MNKKEAHKQDLLPLLDDFLKTGSAKGLKEYIAANSNLPGPRGNLELAQAFADTVQERATDTPQRMWQLCADLVAVSASDAPTNDPRELLPFCGAVGMGAIGATCPKFFQQAVTSLRTLANDPRWRMREAVAMGLQRLMLERPADTLQALYGWLADGGLLELRAVAAAVAEPPLLKNTKTALSALELHRCIFDRVIECRERKSDEFKALRKGLGYTLSLVVQALPQAGFDYMHHLLDTNDPDILWVVKENSKKNRLVKNFPAQIEAVKERLRR